MLRFREKEVNLLLLLVLCLQASNLLFIGLLPQYVRIIFNEAFFIFLPAYLYLRLTRQPVRERVGWSWPGWRAAALALLVGAGLYPLSAVSAEVFMQLLGYSSFTLPDDIIPTTLGAALLAVLAYAVMAPLCEEFLFRGVIQPVYARRGARWAIVFTGLLFVVFHLSLLQGLSIIPISLALGYVYHRTRSLPASILTHFAANFLAALVLTQNVFQTGIAGFLFQPAVIGAGLAAAVLALVLLARLPRPESASAAPREPLPVSSDPPASLQPQPSLLASAWPLLAGAALYLVVIGLEVVEARSPERLAQPLALESPAWQPAQRWEYQILNIAREPVGEAHCELTSAAQQIELVCTSQTRGYEVQQGQSYYASAGGERTERARWQPGGQLLEGASREKIEALDYRLDTHWEMDEQGFSVWTSGPLPEQNQHLPLDKMPGQGGKPVFTGAAWPWQAAGMKLAQGERGLVQVFNSHTWRQETQDNGPLAVERLVRVEGTEQVSTPAGEVSAWKVSLGSQQTAWFAPGSPPTLVKWQNNIETWELK